ncbi:MAG: hypothetical protein SPD11_09335 [Sphaerochaetaceae bacterium]|nr:hypothetical protein [Sphaerochaetaceae bacterium]
MRDIYGGILSGWKNIGESVSRESMTPNDSTENYSIGLTAMGF